MIIKTLTQLLMALVGIIIFAIGINILLAFNLGMGPFDTLTLVVQKVFHVQEFGNASFLIHFCFAVILLLLRKKYDLSIKLIVISIGSILIISRFINLFNLEIFQMEYNLRLFISNFLLMNWGLFLIAKSNLIIAPFDKLIVAISDYHQCDLGYVRIIGDTSMLLFSLVLIITFTMNVKITLFTLFITIMTGLNFRLYNAIYTQIFRRINE